jgi:hypothetical protein
VKGGCGFEGVCVYVCVCLSLGTEKILGERSQRSETNPKKERPRTLFVCSPAMYIEKEWRKGTKKSIQQSASTFTFSVLSATVFKRKKKKRCG